MGRALPARAGGSPGSGVAAREDAGSKGGRREPGRTEATPAATSYGIVWNPTARRYI